MNKIRNIKRSITRQNVIHTTSSFDCNLSFSTKSEESFGSGREEVKINSPTLLFVAKVVTLWIHTAGLSLAIKTILTTIVSMRRNVEIHMESRKYLTTFGKVSPLCGTLWENLNKINVIIKHIQ